MIAHTFEMKVIRWKMIEDAKKGVRMNRHEHNILKYQLKDSNFTMALKFKRKKTYDSRNRLMFFIRVWYLDCCLGQNLTKVFCMPMT
jgi:hypothetical protein